MFDDGTVKPSVHIQNLRRYHERPDSPSRSTNNVSSDNRSNQIPDSVSALDNSNSDLDHTVSEIPQDTTFLLQNPTPAGLDPVVSASSSLLDTGTIVSDQLSVNSQPVRRSIRLRNKSKIDYLAAHTGRKPQ
jgi:hypothetical protein